MNGNFLLDTNIIIALMGEDAIVQQQLRQAAATFIPVITLGELYFGARKSLRVEQNVRRVDEFINANMILQCDVETVRRYGTIKNALKLKGKPLPENDIWIAAIALQHDLIVASRDAHFQEIEDLQLEVW